MRGEEMEEGRTGGSQTGGEKRTKESRKDTAAQCLVAVFGFSVMMFLHLFLRTGWGDDGAFAGMGMPMGEFLAYRYETWSSRVLVEAAVKLLTAASGGIWKILNVLMILLLIWIVADLFGGEGRRAKIRSQLSFFALLWCLPVLTLCDAGWIATTLNYLWPLTLGLVAMRPLKHGLREEKCPGWEYVVCPVCMLFAANTEQGAAVLLGVYLLFGGYLFWRKKKLSLFYLILLALPAVSAAFILASPGNAYRFEAEMDQWFPGYDRLSWSQKLLMGFIDCVHYYASAGGSERTNYLFALLTGILFAGVWQKSKDTKFSPAVLTAFIPLTFYWGIGQFANARIVEEGFGRGGHMIGLFGQNRCLPTGAGTFEFLGWISYPWKMVFLQAGVYLGLLVCIGLTICFLHGKSFETLLELMILGAGLFSRIMMGFSPTMYASGERTSLYCSAAILIVCLRNLECFRREEDKEGMGREISREDKMGGKSGKLVLGLYVVGVIGFSIWGSKLALDSRMRMFPGM